MRTYAYIGPDGICRYAGKLLGNGETIEADGSLDGHPLFVPANQHDPEPVIEEEEPQHDDLE